MRAGLGTSIRLQVAEAAAEAVDQARRRIGGRRPDAAIVVATAAWGGRALRELVEIVAERADCETFAGGTVDGLLGGEGWVSSRPALAVLALTDVVEAIAVQADALASDEARAGHELAAALPQPFGPGDLLLVFGDALSLAPTPLLAGLDEALPALSIAGLGATEPAGEGALVWAGPEVTTASCSALFLRGAGPPALAVTQGCRALGPELEVTRARGHWVLALDGRPALEVMRERVGPAIGPGSGEDWTSHSRVLVALSGDGPSAHPLDAPVLRRIVGRDDHRQAVALPEAVRSGSRIALVTLDAECARRDLERRLQGALAVRGDATARPGFGLYLTCPAAGDWLLEGAAQSRMLATALGGAPLLGVSSAYQIAPGPAGRGGVMHTYSGVVAILG